MKSKSVSGEQHVINDPIHGVMDFTTDERDLIKPIIDHPYFQRLRHIKQLGMADLVFPGAVHTRFNHSIGCCYVGKQLARSIGLYAGHKLEKDISILMVSNLLHDIGHGPFSHAFEGLFEDSENNRPIIKHEHWTPHFLNHFQNDGVLNMSEIDIQSVAGAIEHDPKFSKSKLIADIVSSQLDADRLDYLLRDSHFSGVSYGIYDLKWLIRCVTQISEASKKPRLGIRQKGIGVVEQYLLARRQMLKNVYYNGKIKAAEFLLVELLKGISFEIKRRKAESSKLIPPPLLRFLIGAEELRVSVGKAPKQANKLRNAFLKAQFQNYAMLTDQDVWAAARNIFTESNKGHSAYKFAERLMTRSLPKVYSIETSAKEGAQFVVSELRKTLKLEHWELGILDQPLNSYKGASDPVLILNADGTTRTLSESSYLVGAVADKVESISFLRIDQGIDKRKRDRIVSTLTKKHYLSEPLAGR